MPRFKHHRMCAIACAGIFVLAVAVDAQAADWTASQAVRADAAVAQFLRTERRDGKLPPPSLALAVGIDGTLVFAKGFGHAGPGIPATARTVYHIGSLTKQFTAAGVLRLIEDGARAPLSGRALGLTTPMREIFEGVQNWTAKDEPPVTIRSLLNMTSNLPNFTRRPPPGVDPWGAVAAPRLLDALKGFAPRGWPHSFEYSNTSYFLLGQIIERTQAVEREKAASYRDYLRAALFDPAGMAHTGFVGQYPAGAQLALPHYRRRPAFSQPDWLNGSGDMASNVLDLFAWNTALMSGRILRPAARAAMFADGGRVDPMTYYGMGWFIEHGDGWDAYSHSGSVPGYTAYNAIVVRPETSSWMSVTLLTNSDGIDGLDQLADDLFDITRGE
jgi:CubicO group peptidase (beta-lactamase class C family)